MTQRSFRFSIERPVEYRFTDTRGGPRLQGRSINISSTGVLFRTEEKIGVGRKMEVIVRMAQLAPTPRKLTCDCWGSRCVVGTGGWRCRRANIRSCGRRGLLLSLEGDAADFTIFAVGLAESSIPRPYLYMAFANFLD